jgi:hypothetical protein
MPDGATQPVRSDNAIKHAVADAYDRLVERMPGVPGFATLHALYGDFEDAHRHALGYAKEHGFLVEWQLVILEQTGLFPPEFSDLIVDKIKDRFSGGMQALIDDRRMFNARVLVDLIRAGRACALVTANGAAATRQGTGVLVTGNLLLTAAHIVEPLVVDATAPAGSASAIEIEFRNRLEAPSGEWPRKVEADAEWLVGWSPPCGIYPNLAEGAADKLDFALIRLKDEIGGEIEPLNAENPPAPVNKHQILVIGHPGKSDLLFHGDEILDLPQATARVLHGASTLEGMSGSPCLDFRGRLVAIHEGNVEDQTKNPPKFNRAIELRAIRRAMQAGERDPLAPALSDYLWKIDDPNLRMEWAKAGQQGIQQALEPDWVGALSRFGPNSPQREDAFYPIVGRASFQRWIDEARTSEPRIAFVYGGRASGKSFSAAILRAKLPSREDARVIIGAEPVRRANPEELLSLMLDAVRPGGQALATPEAESTRPAAGVLRHDQLMPALDEIQGHMPVRLLRRVWVIADFEKAETWQNAGVALFWNQLLESVRERSWLRVILTGLGEAAVGELRSKLGETRTFVDRIGPLQQEELRETARRMLRALAPDADKQSEESWLLSEWSTATSKLSNAYSEHRDRVEAVRLLYDFRERLRTGNAT